MLRATGGKEPAASHHTVQKTQKRNGQTVTMMLQRLGKEDEEKYRLLSSFYTQLKSRSVLPEAEDIRHFAQMIGIKEIRGKSRKDLLSKLMRKLLDHPSEQLRGEIISASGVSAVQRQKGFSVITDKLVGERE